MSSSETSTNQWSKFLGNAMYWDVSLLPRMPGIHVHFVRQMSSDMIVVSVSSLRTISLPCCWDRWQAWRIIRMSASSWLQYRLSKFWMADVETDLTSCFTKAPSKNDWCIMRQIFGYMFDDVVRDVLIKASLVTGSLQKLSVVWYLSITADLIGLLILWTTSFAFCRFDGRGIIVLPGTHCSYSRQRIYNARPSLCI